MNFHLDRPGYLDDKGLLEPQAFIQKPNASSAQRVDTMATSAPNFLHVTILQADQDSAACFIGRGG